jgi:trans-aconitate 2-methyltransferase
VTIWNDAQYLKFSDERTRAAHELLARVPLAEANRVVDLGCGPGNSTALLWARWPGAQVVGVDNSADMLRRARADAPDTTLGSPRRGIDWIEADVGTWRPDAPVDVLFANAVLHWLPDHATLVPALFECVRPGGAFAVQMPHNYAEPSHRAMRNLPGPWTARIEKVSALTPAEKPAFYYDLLAPRAAHVDIWETRYEHVMTDGAAIVEWVKGTGLRPYLDALSEDERAGYLDAYLAAIETAYPKRADGKRLFSFPRLFLVAVRRI